MTALARRIAAHLLPLFIALTAAGCGDVGQDGTGAVPPVQADTLTTGVINGFGSVVVNGTHFDVSHADITIDGTPGQRQTDLRVGMVVEVAGTVSADRRTGVATHVAYESLLRGPVDSITSAEQSLLMLGQVVTVDDTTLFAGIDDLSQLIAGNELQVSGFRRPDGSLRATWISLMPAPTEPALVTVITSTSGNTVQASGLNIDISNTQRIDFAGAAPAAGQRVRVVLQAAPLNGAAVATRLRLINTRSVDSLQNQQRQGFVSGWDAVNREFTLDGQRVKLLSSTQAVDGDLAALADGARVEVTGLLANGNLEAGQLRFILSMLRAYGRGRVSAVAADAGHFTLLAGPGIEVHVRSETILNDGDGGTLSLANLQVGDEVIVVGQDDGNRIDAVLVSRMPINPMGSGVAGPVQSISGHNVQILGVTVTTDANTTFLDNTGTLVDANTFFAGLATGDMVHSEGTPGAGTLAASTMWQLPRLP